MFYPTPEDYLPIEDTYEYEFRNRLNYFSDSYKKMICSNFTLRYLLMENDYKASVINAINLKYNYK